ncbi:MAG: hypothetical protein RLZZ330_114 [Actinomycetota bacterium]|jgi:hypothetical protein
MKIRQLRNQINLRNLLSENGDVPGWVLVTVMTAGLVTGIWVVADGQLNQVLDNAITNVAFN